ncbi:MAG TPA: 50S ribosomal protein L23 [archaeon]|nr:50S ribosomal protein L23 [archaeon]
MVDKKDAKASVKKTEPVKADKKVEVKKEPLKQEKKEEKQEQKKTKKTLAEIESEMHALHMIKFPLITEKAVGMIDSQNKLTFIVDRNATKHSVKKSVEDAYKVKVKKVNIIKDMKARKKAIVTIDKKFKADDIATKLGVI